MRTHLMYNRLPVFGADLGGGGGGGNGSVPNAGNKPQNNQNAGGTGDGGNQNNNNNNNNGGNGNNQGGFDLNSGNIWALPENKNPGGDGNNRGNAGNNQNNNNGGNNNPPADPMQGFNTYVNGLDFGVKFTPEAIQKLQQSGDATALATEVQNSMRNVYKQAMVDASRMLNTSIDKAVQSAVEKATQHFQTDKTIDALNEAIPIAKNPNVAPVAQAAFSAFLKAGKNRDDAIKSTKDFLAAMRQFKNEDLGLPPGNAPGNGRNRNSGQNQAENEDLVDWMSFANG